MNIFALDSDPVLAAQMLCDKHVIKMTLETAQILCTVSDKFNVPAQYKSTHAKHPSVLWAGTTLGNWTWTVLHGLAIAAEYTKRYGKIHKSQAVIEWIRDFGGKPGDGKLQKFSLAMPDSFKNKDRVKAYRSYYLGAKKDIATWKKPSTSPDWWI